RGAGAFDGVHFFLGSVGGGLVPGDGLAERPGVGPRVDAGKHHPVPASVEQGKGVRQVGSCVVQRVVSNETNLRDVPGRQRFQLAQAAFQASDRRAILVASGSQFGEPVGRASVSARNKLVVGAHEPLQRRQGRPHHGKMVEDQRDERTGKCTRGCINRSIRHRVASGKVDTTTRVRWITAPVRARLPLLSSEPGGVHEVTPREAQPPSWPCHDSTGLRRLSPGKSQPPKPRSYDGKVGGESMIAAVVAAAALVLTSDDLRPGATMPRVLMATQCGGSNRKPALHWANVPAGVRSFALVERDPDAPVPGGFYHWVVYNIPATARSLDGSPAAKTGTSTTGHAAYYGPCPPPGQRHHYVFTLYALDV